MTKTSNPSAPRPLRPGRGTLFLRGIASLCLLAGTTFSLGPADPLGASHDGSWTERPGHADLSLRLFEPLDARHLVRVLDGAWQEAGGDGQVPNVAPASLPPGMGQLSVGVRKRALIRAVLPYVAEVNRGIRRDRRALEGIMARIRAGQPLRELERLHVAALARDYRVDGVGAAEDPAAAVRALLLRVDVVPESLAVAQAALETGWGSSRFVVEGNALFGQWVFSGDDGMVPRGRPRGATYAVARFEGLGQSVEAYMRNLNTVWAYEGFRRIRADLRELGRYLDPLRLAEGLELYSERRELYVEEVRQVIRVNGLERFDAAQVLPSARPRDA